MGKSSVTVLENVILGSDNAPIPYKISAIWVYLGPCSYRQLWLFPGVAISYRRLKPNCPELIDPSQASYRDWMWGCFLKLHSRLWSLLKLLSKCDGTYNFGLLGAHISGNRCLENCSIVANPLEEWAFVSRWLQLAWSKCRTSSSEI